MKEFCRRCVIPRNFPHVRFDGQGLCSLCLAPAPSRPEAAGRRAEFRSRFEALARGRCGRGGYDALVCYSGGKDSSYALTLAVREYRLKTLAFTFDNGFLAPAALSNARSVTNRLGVDHFVFKPPATLLSRIFRGSLEPNLYPPKSIERASPICVSCIGFVKYVSFRTAIEKDIPFVLFGWTPGQASVESSILELEPEMALGMADAVRLPMEKIAGESLAAYFPEPSAKKFPCLVHPAAFSGYDEKKIYRTIAALGWKKPAGLDANSTNCLLNSFNVAEHKKRHGFNPYTYEIARLVREGYLSRSEGLKRIQAPVPASAVRAARRRLEA